MNERPPTADMPLVDFVVRFYMNAPHHRGGKMPGKAVLYKLLTICDHMDAVLNRPPRVSDLNADTLHAVRQHAGHVLNLRRVTVLQYGDAFKGLWRYAADLGLIPIADELRKKSYIWNPDHNGNAVKLSAEPGTLWHICLKPYFPRNLRIRSDETKMQYQYALRDFKQVLGHDPTPADLTDDNLIDLMRAMVDRDKAPKTVNERRGRIAALWKWMACRRLVDHFPTVPNLKEPRRIPKAWTREEMNKLLEACRHVGGKIGAVWASDWWVALHLLLWDTAERISATLAIKWEWIDWHTGFVTLPAEVRKGQDADAAYPLGSDTLAALARIRENNSPLVFHLPGKQEAAKLYAKYKVIRREAGLPAERGVGFHRMRRSVASHLHAAGHNATDALGHRSAEVTRDHYLDPRITGGPKPCEALFRLDQGEAPLLPAEPKLLEYREHREYDDDGAAPAGTVIPTGPDMPDLSGLAWL